MIKKKKFTAYNVLYKDGKATGKKFKYDVGESKEALKKKVERQNKDWNKMPRKGGYKVKLVEIKEAKKKKKRFSDPYNFGVDFGLDF